jgi:hypothetical protein
MMEYRVAKGWRIFSLTIAVGLLILGVVLIERSFAFQQAQSKMPLVIFGVILIPFAILIYRETAMHLLTIDDQSVTLRRGFYTRSIRLADIDGYRRGEKNALYIVSKNGGKQVRISDYLENRKELVEWLKEKYTDLDARRVEEETKEILEDDRFGGTAEEREIKLKNARQVARGGIAVSFLVFLWVLFFPEPFEVLMLVTFALPLAGLYAVWHYKGLLRLVVKKTSAYPSALYLLFMPVLAAWVSILRGYELYPVPGSAWRMMIVIAVLLAGIGVLACRAVLSTDENTRIGYLLILLIAGLYSYNIVVFSNCYYDRVRPERYRVQVLSKTLSRGKSTSYHLHLSSWGIYGEGRSVSVARTFYNAVDVNDSVSVYLKPGKWNIPWYRVVRQ